MGGRLSPVAVDILEKIPRQFVVERSDLVKELKAFRHHSSKGLHHLGFELAHGLYCGGEPLVLSAMVVVICLLQKKGCVLGEVSMVDVAGKMVFSAKDGVLNVT